MRSPYSTKSWNCHPIDLQATINNQLPTTNYLLTINSIEAYEDTYKPPWYTTLLPRPATDATITKLKCNIRFYTPAQKGQEQKELVYYSPQDKTI